MAPCPWEGNSATFSFDTAASDSPLLVSTCSAIVSAASWHRHASALANGFECADAQPRVLPAFAECRNSTLRCSSRTSLTGKALTDNVRLGFAALSADPSAGPADADVASPRAVDANSEAAAHHDRTRAGPERSNSSKRLHTELLAAAGDVQAQSAASDAVVSSVAHAIAVYDAASDGDGMSAPSGRLSQAQKKNSDWSAAATIWRFVGGHSTGAPSDSSRDGGADGGEAFIPGAAVKPMCRASAAAEAAGYVNEAQQGTSSDCVAPKDEQKKRHRKSKSKSKSKRKASSSKRMELEGGDADMLPAPADASAARCRPNTSVPGIFLGDLFVNSSSR